MVCGQSGVQQGGLRGVDTQRADVHKEGFRGCDGFPVDHPQGCGSECGVQREPQEIKTVPQVMDENSEPD